MRRHRDILERLVELLLEQQAIAKPGQGVVVGKILRPRLQLLAIGDLRLQPLIGINQAPGPLFDAALEILIGLAQPLIGQRNLLLCAPAAELRIDARQRYRKIHRLGDIVVRALLERIDDVVALRFGRNHDHRQGGSRFSAANALEGLHSVDARHHHVEENEIERALFDQIDRDQTGIRFRDIKASTLKAPLEDTAIVADVVDDQQGAAAPPAVHRSYQADQEAKKPHGDWYSNWTFFILLLNLLILIPYRWRIPFRLLLGHPGKHAYRKARTLPDFALDRDSAAHQRTQLLTQREAKPGAAIFARSRAVRLAEILEQPADVVFRDADAGVLHLDLDPVSRLTLPALDGQA